MGEFFRSGTIIDIRQRRFFPGTVHVKDGIIADILEDDEPKDSCFILPGFIDAHIHVESSMLVPSEFARLASVHGTVAVVSDPHEIANVCGISGIRYMIDNGKQVPFHFYFGVPSCVPATSFETAGATISAADVETLFREDGLKYLAEVMNFPGVLQKDPVVMEKIRIAKMLGRPVDGHAPGMRGEQAATYIAAGIDTDHECFTLEEALDKIKSGMHIIIREGSAAKNYDALHPLIGLFPEKVMFGSDDKHPHELALGHINELVKRSIDHGYDPMDVLRIASLHPRNHYNLDVGLLGKGDVADFIVINNLTEFKVLETYVSGILVAEKGKTLIKSVYADTPNQFHARKKSPSDFISKASSGKIHEIVVEEGQLVTEDRIVFSKTVTGLNVPDIQRDILKLTVVNRYKEAKPAVAFVQNFGLKRGAIASCVAHDSHNLIAVGCSDEEICSAINLLIANKGGLAAVDGNEEHILPLPVAGIMSNEDGYEVAKKYEKIAAVAKKLGSSLQDPFMTLSFMALLVIPELKLSDKGLFDGVHFRLIPLNSN